MRRAGRPQAHAAVCAAIALQATEMTQQATEMTQHPTEMTQHPTEVTQQATDRTQQATEMTQQATEMTQQATEMTQQATEMTQQATEMTQQANQVPFPLSLGRFTPLPREACFLDSRYNFYYTRTMNMAQGFRLPTQTTVVSCSFLRRGAKMSKHKSTMLPQAKGA